jgi:hypothetical protein
MSSTSSIRKVSDHQSEVLKNDHLKSIFFRDQCYDLKIFVAFFTQNKQKRICEQIMPIVSPKIGENASFLSENWSKSAKKFDLKIEPR